MKAAVAEFRKQQFFVYVSLDFLVGSISNVCCSCNEGAGPNTDPNSLYISSAFCSLGKFSISEED